MSLNVALHLKTCFPPHHCSKSSCDRFEGLLTFPLHIHGVWFDLLLEYDHKSYHILLLYQPTLPHTDHLHQLDKFMIFLPPLQEDLFDLFVL
jgi:hypothetical protein